MSSASFKNKMLFNATRQFDSVILYVFIFSVYYAFFSVADNPATNVDKMDFDPAALAGLAAGLDYNSSTSFLDSCIPGKGQETIKRELVENVKTANFSELPGLVEFASAARRKLKKVRANITKTGVAEVCKEFWGHYPGVELEQPGVFLDCLLQNVQFLEDTLVEEVLTRTKT